MSEKTSIESRFDIQARWRPVIESAGLDSPSHTPENSFMLAGAILHDPVVAKMRMREEFQITDPENPAAFATNWSLLFDKMGPGGRAALKERVRKAHGIQ